MSNRHMNDQVDVIGLPTYPPASVGRVVMAIKYTVAICGGLLLGCVCGLVIALSNDWVMIC